MAEKETPTVPTVTTLPNGLVEVHYGDASYTASTPTKARAWLTGQGHTGKVAGLDDAPTVAAPPTPTP